MAIQSQFNPIRFFTDKRARQWDKTPEAYESMVFYPSGTLPFFEFGTDVSLVYPDHYRFKVYDSSDVEILAIGEINTNIVYQYPDGNYSVGYSGGVFDGVDDGYYYIVLTDGVSTYYSDMFALTDRTPELLKVYVETTPVTVGGLSVALSQNTFYLNAEMLGIKPKIEQVGQEQDAITRILHGSRAVSREFEIDANESIYIYLSALGLINANGLVTFTYGYETWTAADITIEESTFHGNGLSQLKLSFVDESETVSVFNGY